MQHNEDSRGPILPTAPMTALIRRPTANYSASTVPILQLADSDKTLSEQIDVLEQNWSKFDFFFLHYKYTDSTGEDGNFDAKVKKIEEFDAAIPLVTALKPKVLIVTGDHSTPSYLQAHSWHPVPTLLVSDCCRPDGHTTFGENTSIRGGLGQFKAKYLMTLALANAGRLGKYGA
jgi:2,3-bisphosphoglycerate-independent phosphoglycerate mutase